MLENNLDAPKTEQLLVSVASTSASTFMPAGERPAGEVGLWKADLRAIQCWYC